MAYTVFNFTDGYIYISGPHCIGIGIGIGIGLLKIHIAASKAELHEITVNYINANCKTLCNM